MNIRTIVFAAAIAMLSSAPPATAHPLTVEQARQTVAMCSAQLLDAFEAVKLEAVRTHEFRAKNPTDANQIALRESQLADLITLTVRIHELYLARAALVAHEALDTPTKYEWNQVQRAFRCESLTN